MARVTAEAFVVVVGTDAVVVASGEQGPQSRRLPCKILGSGLACSPVSHPTVTLHHGLRSTEYAPPKKINRRHSPGPNVVRLTGRSLLETLAEPRSWTQPKVEAVLDTNIGSAVARVARIRPMGYSNT